MLQNIKLRYAHFLINIFIFNFLSLLHVSNPKDHLQEDGCICSYGIVGY